MFQVFNRKICGYYEYENDDSTQPICPKDVAILDTINGEIVTEITESAFYLKTLTSVIIIVKFNSSNFTTYNPNWGWDEDVTCVKDNTSDVENGFIIWISPSEK